MVWLGLLAAAIFCGSGLRIFFSRIWDWSPGVWYRCLVPICQPLVFLPGAIIGSPLFSNGISTKEYVSAVVALLGGLLVAGYLSGCLLTVLGAPHHEALVRSSETALKCRIREEPFGYWTELDRYRLIIRRWCLVSALWGGPLAAGVTLAVWCSHFPPDRLLSQSTVFYAWSVFLIASVAGMAGLLGTALAVWVTWDCGLLSFWELLAGLETGTRPPRLSAHSAITEELGRLKSAAKGAGSDSHAESLWGTYVDTAKRSAGEASSQYAISLNDRAIFLEKTGRYADALTDYRQALAIWRRHPRRNRQFIATALANAADLLRQMGEPDEAHNFLREALTLLPAAYRRRPRTRDQERARCWFHLGLIAGEAGARALAVRHLRRAYELARRVHSPEDLRLGSIAHQLALAEVLCNDLAVAQRHADEALAVKSRAGTSSVLYDRWRDAPGEIHLARGNWNEAIEHLLAVHDAQAQLREQDLQAILMQERLGDAYAGRDSFAEAFSHKQAAADRTLGHMTDLFQALPERARLAVVEKLSRSLDRYLSLVFRSFRSDPEVVGRAFDTVLRRKGLGLEFLQLQRDAIFSGRYPHAQESLRRLRHIRARLAQKTLSGPGSDESVPTHGQQLVRWHAEREHLERELAGEIPELRFHQQLREAGRDAVARALPEGVALVEFVRFDVYDFRAVSARGEQQWQPVRYLAFVLPAGRPEQVRMIDLGEADPIDRMIADFRAVIAVPPWRRPRQRPEAPSPSAGNLWCRLSDLRKRPDRGQKPQPDADDGPADFESAPPADFSPAGDELRQRLFDPLLQALGDRKQLWLAPDGDLAFLPFELLPDREKGKLLLDTYCISYLGTGRDALRCGRPATRQPGPALVAVDPDFDLGSKPQPAPAAGEPPGRRSRAPDLATLRFDPLPGTRKEGERIAVLLNTHRQTRIEPWLGTKVLEAQLKKARSPWIVHLATHAFFLPDPVRSSQFGFDRLGMLDRHGIPPENPLLCSGLALAGANWKSKGFHPPAEAEDGMLTAEDVTGLDLLDTELVVLSACETGLGQVHVGEGVFGLRRAFAVAGAKTLVMSLWKVPDDQTQELMVDFYRRILKGEPRAEALRQAQQAIRARHPDPYYWGAFVCQGDPGPLPG
jgi:CHAT domain-containing protein/tetratricopeptide (TPR) repeat protein